jgi:hypothetical protein
MQVHIANATHMTMKPPHPKIITTIVRSIKVTVYPDERMPTKPLNIHYGSMTMARMKKMAFCKSHHYVITSILCCKIIPITTNCSTDIRLMNQMMVTNMYFMMVDTVS